MRLIHLCGTAVLALTVSAEAQELDRWQPGDCASIEAGSLEAALLDCNTEPASGQAKRVANPFSATATSAASAEGAALAEDLLSGPPDPAAASNPVQISSQNW